MSRNGCMIESRMLGDASPPARVHRRAARAWCPIVALGYARYSVLRGQKRQETFEISINRSGSWDHGDIERVRMDAMNGQQEGSPLGCGCSLRRLAHIRQSVMKRGLSIYGRIYGAVLSRRWAQPRGRCLELICARLRARATTRERDKISQCAAARALGRTMEAFSKTSIKRTQLEPE